MIRNVTYVRGTFDSPNLLLIEYHISITANALSAVRIVVIWCISFIRSSLMSVALSSNDYGRNAEGISVDFNIN